MNRWRGLVGLLCLMNIVSESTPAATTKNCDLDSLTNMCAAFKEANAKKPMPLTISSGGKGAIPNFDAIGAITTKSAAHSSYLTRTGELQSYLGYSTLKTQQDILNRLAAIRNEVLPPISRLFVAKLLTENAGVIQNDPRWIVVPWPISSPTGILKRMPAQDYYAALSKTLGPYEMEQLGLIRQEALKLMQRDLNVLSDEEQKGIDGLSTVTPEREEEIKTIYQKAKKALINSHLKRFGISSVDQIKSLPEEQQNWFKILDTVKLLEADKINPNLFATCAGSQGGYNAFYSPNDHGFFICPAFKNLPDEAIAQFIGHELSHAVDPCMSQFAVYSINRSSLENLRDSESGQMTKELATDPTAALLYETLLSTAFTGDTYTRGIIELQSSPEVIEDFVRRGLIKKIISGVPSEKYPMKKEVQCLTGRGMRFRKTKNSDITEMAKEVAKRAKEVSNTKVDQKKIRKVIAEQYQKHPHCSSVGLDSQVGESFADLGGTLVSADLVDGKNLHSDQDRLRILSAHAMSACASEGSLKKLGKKELSSKEIVDLSMSAMQRHADSHPSDHARANKILLRHPSVRAALGCEPSLKKSCFDNFTKTKEKTLSAPAQTTEGGLQ